MNISQVIAKATKDVEIIKDGNIFYLVLNQGETDFTFDEQTCYKMMAALDEVEKSTGPAVLVTVSAAKKRFSTGFNLDYWKKDKLNPLRSVALGQKMLARFLTVNVPSLCVINGHCYAGGLILALCHDFRTMHVNGGKLCLSEINVGMSLAPAYDALCKSLMGVQIYRDMVMGRAILPKEAFETRVISSMYTSEEDVMK